MEKDEVFVRCWKFLKIFYVVVKRCFVLSKIEFKLVCIWVFKDSLNV